MPRDFLTELLAKIKREEPYPEYRTPYGDPLDQEQILEKSVAGEIANKPTVMGRVLNPQVPHMKRSHPEVVADLSIADLINPATVEGVNRRSRGDEMYQKDTDQDRMISQKGDFPPGQPTPLFADDFLKRFQTPAEVSPLAKVLPRSLTADRDLMMSQKGDFAPISDKDRMIAQHGDDLPGFSSTSIPTPDVAEEKTAEQLELERQLAALKKEKNPITDLNFGNNAIASQETLKAIQDEANRRRSSANFRRHADMLGAGISGAKPTDAAYFNEDVKQADQLVADYEAKLQLEKRDPNSSFSTGLRDYFKKLGINVSGAASASDLEKLLPQAVKQYENSEERKLRGDMMTHKLAAMKDIAKEKAGGKKDADKEKADQKTDSWITQRYDKLTHSKTYESLNKVLKAKKTIDDAIANPSAIKDLGSLYEVVKILDSESAVREGELKLGREALGKRGAVKAYLSQYGKDPRLLTPEFMQQIKSLSQNLYSSYRNEYDTLRAPIYAQAKHRGLPEERYGEFDPIKLIEDANKQTEANPTASADPMIKVRINGQDVTAPKSKLEDIQKRAKSRGDKIEVIS